MSLPVAKCHIMMGKVNILLNQSYEDALSCFNKALEIKTKLLKYRNKGKEIKEILLLIKGTRNLINSTVSTQDSGSEDKENFLAENSLEAILKEQLDESGLF